MNFQEYRCRNYVIGNGDTLYSISREYNVPLPLILRLNPFVDIYNLQVGDEICIPVIEGASQDQVSEYVVAEGDSVQTVLDKYAIDMEDLIRNNSLSSMMLLPGIKLNIPNNND